ncbi:MAG: cytochrome c biogenesis protein DipZ [Abditibacteriaceae bacterium]
MILLLGSFIAGILTVLAPCVLPLLPVIIGGAVSGDTKDARRPFIIAGALAISILAFTLLLKATTLLINVPPQIITYISGGIIIVLGLTMLFPNLYTIFISRVGAEGQAQKLLGKGAQNKSNWIGPIIIGAALGPVFSSCSPVYGYILATVLPAHFAQAMAYMISYVLGLSLTLLAIGYYGQRFTSKIKFFSDPRGIFQRALAVLFILVGILVVSGTGVKVQTYLAGHTPLNFDALSARLLPKGKHELEDANLYNVKKPYKAPDLVGIKDWINSNPLTMQQLKGKVVLIDFWTYSCINCIRSLPYVNGWYEQYHKDGLVVIGVHAPEFSFEKVPANVKAAVKKDGITYPVALDSDLKTWNAYSNQYWPAEYLIDRNGNVRREHFGEGEYDQTEKAIRGLLAEGNGDNGMMLPNTFVAKPNELSPINDNQTPETYLGQSRAENYVGSPELYSQETQEYTFAKSLKINEWSLSGKWKVQDDKVTAVGNSKLRLHFASKNVYLVAGSTKPSMVGVRLNGKLISSTENAGSDVSDNHLIISQHTLYRLVRLPKYGDGIVELSVPNGTDLNVFTFGN